MTDDHLTPEDRALCEALGTYDPFREGCVIGFSIAPKAAARIRDLSAQLADHPTAEDYRNRAERAEQEAAELRGHDAFYLATALMAAQRKIDALQQHAEAMAEALDGINQLYIRLADSGDAGFWEPREESEVIAATQALANWTAWLIDNPQGD